MPGLDCPGRYLPTLAILRQAPVQKDSAESVQKRNCNSDDLYDALLREKEWLMRAGQWLTSPPRLEKLLVPD